MTNGTEFLPNEEWLPVKIDGGAYADRYEVSDMGRVVRIYKSKERIMRPYPNGGGYLRVGLREKGGPRKQAFVAHLVAHEFIGPKPDGMEINHRDLNRENNSLGNLEYVTSAENKAHALSQQDRVKFLSDSQARNALIMIENGASREWVASRFGCVANSISHWISGKIRPHLLKERLEATGLTHEEYKRLVGRKCLGPSQVNEIVLLRKSGWKFREIAEKFASKTSTVAMAYRRATLPLQHV